MARIPKPKPYALHKCRDCEKDFLAARIKRHKALFCPICGENQFVDKVANITIPRTFLYNRPWTEEEDQLLYAGIASGASNSQLALEMKDRTAAAIRARKYRLFGEAEAKARKEVKAQQQAVTAQ